MNKRLTNLPMVIIFFCILPEYISFAGNVTTVPAYLATPSRYIPVGPGDDVVFKVKWTNGSVGSPGFGFSGGVIQVNGFNSPPGTTKELDGELGFPQSIIGSTNRIDITSFNHVASDGFTPCSSENTDTFYVAVQEPTSVSELGSPTSVTGNTTDTTSLSGMNHTYLVKDSTSPTLTLTTGSYKVHEHLTVRADITINGTYNKGMPGPFDAIIDGGAHISPTGTFTDLIAYPAKGAVSAADPTGSLANGSTIIVVVYAIDHEYDALCDYGSDSNSYTLTPKVQQASQITITKSSGTWTVTDVREIVGTP